METRQWEDITDETINSPINWTASSNNNLCDGGEHLVGTDAMVLQTGKPTIPPTYCETEEGGTVEPDDALDSAGRRPFNKAPLVWD